MKLITQLFYICSIMVCTLPVTAVIVDSKHNLSPAGPGKMKAPDGTPICVFCHTPPNSKSTVLPLWSRHASDSGFISSYSEITAQALPGQPSGASLLCLGCHDGTIAVIKVMSRPERNALTENITTIPEGIVRLKTDLSNDHPVSFQYTSALAAQKGELIDPATLPEHINLDSWGQIQCGTCHSPHDNTNNKFLVVDNTASALCRICHAKNGWPETAHSTAAKSWNGVTPDPWPTTDAVTVADNACLNCHMPHNAGSDQRLLRYAIEEDNCYPCHNGHVASKNIQAEFKKPYRHPIMDTRGVHSSDEKAVVNSRHVECQDCHNPHAANADNPLSEVRGVSIQGNEIRPINKPYQLCLRCHSDSTGKKAPRTARQFPETNLRLEFDISKASYHPVAGPGKNSYVPSLISPLTTSSRISCLDCHNNNNGPGAGGIGPSGPHGSDYEPILERRYETLDGTIESPSAYAMCYKCHDRNRILGDTSFPRHKLHIVGWPVAKRGLGVRTPCNVCHDPHASEQEKLINFDTTVVSPYKGIVPLKFVTTPTGGQCYLTCHGWGHNPCTYNRTTGQTACVNEGPGG